MEAAEIEAVLTAITERLDAKVRDLVKEYLGEQLRGTDEAIARLDDIRQTIEQLRDEFTQTVEVLEGNDQVLLGEIRRTAGAEAWERFVKAEAVRVGLRFMEPKA